jgi:predicted nuclease of predicted toxin-antitoxin system
MRLLLDANLSPGLASALVEAGYQAEHVSDVGLASATDDLIFEYAAANALVVVTADTDFSMMLALRRAATPSVVLLRHVAELRPAAHAALLVANLPQVIADLDAGAIVSLSPVRLSVRRLPLDSNGS